MRSTVTGTSAPESEVRASTRNRDILHGGGFDDCDRIEFPGSSSRLNRPESYGRPADIATDTAVRLIDRVLRFLRCLDSNINRCNNISQPKIISLVTYRPKTL